MEVRGVPVFFVLAVIVVAFSFVVMGMALGGMLPSASATHPCEDATEGVPDHLAQDYFERCLQEHDL